MQKLAAIYGLSDRGLAKTCSRHLIPVPPRGYWAKLEAGQPVKKTKLRPVENKALHSVYIGSSTVHRSAGVKLVLEAHREKTKGPEQQARREPVVLESGAEPHPFVKSLVKSLRKAKPDGDGLISVCGVAVHHRSLDRAVTALHNLAIAAEAAGATVKSTDERVFLVDDIGSAAIELVEERRRPKHVPTEQELAEYAKLKAKRDRNRERDIWTFERLETWPEFDIVYTGKLKLGFTGWVSGLRQSWSDGKTKTVESMADDIIVGLRLIIAANAEDSRIRQENELRRQALHEQSVRRKKREEREGKRTEFFEFIERDRRQLAEWRGTLRALPSADEMPQEYAAMILWAEQRISHLEKSLSVESIQQALVDKNLFPSPDDLADP
ncbi:hypothetical protein [Agrobacterium cavarae]|uniref:hypothetical protein n=1 Tax=Agrobacterium cavarae TaxID=2528239 RepID=UPI002896A5AC|nr:hypothetical protein [Agrobacterium cavarae]